MVAAPSLCSCPPGCAFWHSGGGACSSRCLACGWSSLEDDSSRRRWPQVGRIAWQLASADDSSRGWPCQVVGAGIAAGRWQVRLIGREGLPLEASLAELRDFSSAYAECCEPTRRGGRALREAASRAAELLVAAAPSEAPALRPRSLYVLRPGGPASPAHLLVTLDSGSVSGSSSGASDSSSGSGSGASEIVLVHVLQALQPRQRSAEDDRILDCPTLSLTPRAQSRGAPPSASPCGSPAALGAAAALAESEAVQPTVQSAAQPAEAAAEGVCSLVVPRRWLVEAVPSEQSPWALGSAVRYHPRWVAKPLPPPPPPPRAPPPRAMPRPPPALVVAPPAAALPASVGPWLCSRCQTSNAADDERCAAPRCQLARAVVGVDLRGESGDLGRRRSAGRRSDGCGGSSAALSVVSSAALTSHAPEAPRPEYTPPQPAVPRKRGRPPTTEPTRPTKPKNVAGAAGRSTCTAGWPTGPTDVAAAVPDGDEGSEADDEEREESEEAYVWDVRQVPTLPSPPPHSSPPLPMPRCRWYRIHLVRTGEWRWCAEEKLRKYVAGAHRVSGSGAGAGHSVRSIKRRRKSRGSAPPALVPQPSDSVGKLERELQAQRVALEELQARRRHEARVRDFGRWREWQQLEHGLVVRSCSWGRVDEFMRRMRSACAADEHAEFNIDYIIRQLEVMRDGPSANEAHVMLQLQGTGDRDGASGEGGAPTRPTTRPAFSSAAADDDPGRPLADASEALGVVAATVRMSRRLLSLEFRAIYVLPRLRRQNLANALVHFALDDVRQQVRQGQPHALQAQLAEGWRVQWTEAALRSMISFVTLPHCMQTSAKFWARVGFELGKKVDPKEQKQATLRAAANLKGDVAHWRPCHLVEQALPSGGHASAGAR